MKKYIDTIENNKKMGEDLPGCEAGPLHLGSPMDRRSFIAGSTLVAGGMLAYPLMVSSTAKQLRLRVGARAQGMRPLCPTSVSLWLNNLRGCCQGALRVGNSRGVSCIKNIAGVLMTLKPGGLRELHWHANAAEWAYVIEGNVRVTIVDPQGRIEIADFAPGDVCTFLAAMPIRFKGLPSGRVKRSFCSYLTTVIFLNSQHSVSRTGSPRRPRKLWQRVSISLLQI